MLSFCKNTRSQNYSNINVNTVYPQLKLVNNKIITVSTVLSLHHQKNVARRPIIYECEEVKSIKVSRPYVRQADSFNSCISKINLLSKYNFLENPLSHL